MKHFKKLLAMALFGLGLGIVAVPFAYAAGPTTFTVSTVTPNGSLNGSAVFTAAGFPNVTGGAKLRKIVIDNLTSPSADRVTIWTTCTSSTTAVAKFNLVVPASTTVTYDFLPNNFNTTSPCVQKGIVDLNAVMKATLVYE
jgi:hypothetical protein